jgi:uncharacterized damage-inducible protein DinB
VEILRDVSAAQAAARPLEYAHSIWELVLHITGWKREVTKRLSGRAATLPEDGDWPEVGEPTPSRWAETLSRLDATHRQLVNAIRALPQEKLFEATNDTRDRAAGAGVLHYVLLHGLIQHDVYHAGQIAILKKGAALP